MSGSVAVDLPAALEISDDLRVLEESLLVRIKRERSVSTLKVKHSH